MKGRDGGDGNQTEIDPKKIAQQVATETLEKIRPNMTEEEGTKIKSDGGVDPEEFKTMIAKGGLKPSALSSQKFNELDTNKNGKLEESEVQLDTVIGFGEDYGFWDWLGGVVEKILVAVAKEIYEDIKEAVG